MACSVRRKMYMELWLKTLKERDHFEDLGIDEKNI
jgi:hypothetical protein